METIRLNKSIYIIIRPLFLTLSFFSVFKGIFGWLFNTNLFEYLDELLFFASITVLLPTFLFRRTLKVIFFLIGFFIIYSIIVSHFFGVSGTILTISIQTLISIKFFIILLAFVELFKNDYETLNNFFLIIVGFAVFGLTLHVIFGAEFNYLIGVSGFSRPHIRYVGFFTHPNHLAYLMLLFVGYVINNKYKINQGLSNSDFIKITIAIVAIILTDSRTAILSIGIILFAFYWKTIRKNYRLILSGLLLTLLSTLYLVFYTNLFDSIVENINDTLDIDSHYIRGNMIYLSGLIFIDYFPIGTGAATFGSVLSDDAVYAIYGQADRYYFANEIGVYDSNLASIIGEYGLIGILFFVMIFKYTYRYLKGFTKNKTLLAALFLIFLFFSSTNPMLTNNVYTILSSIVMVLFVTKRLETSPLPVVE